MQTTATEKEIAPATARPLALLLAIVAGVMRLVPHPWNLASVGALGLFGGARLRSWHAFALPLLVMAGTDLALLALKDNPPFDPYVYASFMIYVLVGRCLIRTESPLWIGGASVLASTQFFLITNFGVWAHGTPYPKTIAGLGECYAAGLLFNQREATLGFFAPTVIGDLAYTAILFGLHAWLSRVYFPEERVELAPNVAPVPPVYSRGTN